MYKDMLEKKSSPLERSDRNIKRNFTQVSNDLINDQRLSWKAKGLLIYLLSKPPNWTAKINDLYKKSTDGYSSLRSGIEDLVLCGYMELKNKYNKDTDKFTGRYYMFHEIPLFTNKYRLPENKNKNFKDDEVLVNEDPRKSKLSNRNIK